MKQFDFVYESDEAFLKELDGIKAWCDTHASYMAVFRIYSQDMNREHIEHLCGILDEQMPEALYFGSTSNANILDGVLSESEIIVTCTIFERETTQAVLMQYPFNEENCREGVQELKAYCDANPWVSAIEVVATIAGMSLKGFCDEMSTLRKDIQMFGGGSFNPNLDDDTAFVFSKGNGFLEHGIVFLLMGGEDFHVYSTFIAGWKPLQRRFRITKAEKEILHELDGKPAFDVYHRYLNIKKNDKFFSNTLEFPLFMEHDGIDILRSPLAVNDDDSLVMASDMEEDAVVRLAYGDPETILRSVRQDGQKVADFGPEVIQMFSCAVRRAFWGDENVSNETELFQAAAPTAGFYTHGEFLRMNGDMLIFNVTLVVVAMREGDPLEGRQVSFYDATLDNLEKIPMISRFVSFIKTATTELEEMNQKIRLAAITDGLTRLYNRMEIERRIREAVDSYAAEPENPLSLIMLDIDSFKKVNDVYGHKEGDNVIIALADILRENAAEISDSAVGRWGGEEFMMLLEKRSVDEAMEIAEKIRQAFADIVSSVSGSHTASVGVTQVHEGESVDLLCSRVDQALYAAKEAGKNRVVRMD